MKKLGGLFLATAAVFGALLPLRVEAGPGPVYVCVESCFECRNACGGGGGICVELLSHCEETGGLACAC